MAQGVFLDRDGVITKAYVKSGIPHPPYSVGETEILEGVAEAIENFRKSGITVIVVTNQPDVARKKILLDEVMRIHEHLNLQLGLENFYMCTHDDLDYCDCRKPLPGLILRAAKELSIELEKSHLVGDRWRDIDAGQAAGCTCFFIDYNYAEKRPKTPFTVVNSLLEASEIIVKEQNVF